MFGKIKGKLKGIFSKHEEEIFEDEKVEEKVDEFLDDEVPRKVEKEFPDKNDQETILDGKSTEKKKIKPLKGKKEKALPPPPPVLDKEEILEVVKEAEIPKKEEVVEESLDFEAEGGKPKKGFFSRMFGKKLKEEEEQEEIKELEEDMLGDVPLVEKEAILKNEEVPNQEKNLEELENKIEKEEEEEKREIEGIDEIRKENLGKIASIKSGNSNFDSKLDEVRVKEKEKEEKKGLFSKAFGKLASKKLSDDDFNRIWIELEIFLLEINIAYEIVQNIEKHLKECIIGESFDRFSLAKRIREVMVEEVEGVLKKRESDLIDKIKEINDSGEIARILVLGVNGTGKTTTIAKFVHLLKKNDISCVVAAADTFRAAAVEQLDEHARKVGFKLIRHSGGSDPAAVAFDAIEHAKAKKLDVVLVDTAGRMPNNSNLMQELDKIKRVASSQINIFIGDSVSGNDLIEQIELFDRVVGISGLILTKTDTDERPGSIVTAAYSIEKPIYYLGIGQTYDDLVKFDAKLIADKLFEID